MPTFYRVCGAALVIALCVAGGVAVAQSDGNFSSIDGTVLDSTAAVVPKAKVEIRNPVSGFDQSAMTDSSGKFQFTNIPFNPYRLTVIAPGFAPLIEDESTFHTDVDRNMFDKLPLERQSLSESSLVTLATSGSTLAEGTRCQYASF